MPASGSLLTIVWKFKRVPTRTVVTVVSTTTLTTAFRIAKGQDQRYVVVHHTLTSFGGPTQSPLP